MAPRQFWQMSDAGDESRRPPRWSGSLHLDNIEQWHLCLGRPVPRDFPPVVVEMEDPGPVEDMPWCGESCTHVVSDRLRRLIESAAPGHAEFLPVSMIYNGMPLDVGPYWAANWLYMVDCFDRERSEYERVEDASREEGYRLRFSLDGFVVDIDKVPDPVQIFRVKYFEVKTLVRRSILSLFEEHGITGPQFYDIKESSSRGVL